MVDNFFEDCKKEYPDKKDKIGEVEVELIRIKHEKNHSYHFFRMFTINHLGCILGKSSEKMWSWYLGIGRGRGRERKKKLEEWGVSSEFFDEYNKRNNKSFQTHLTESEESPDFHFKDNDVLLAVEVTRLVRFDINNQHCKSIREWKDCIQKTIGAKDKKEKYANTVDGASKVLLIDLDDACHYGLGWDMAKGIVEQNAFCFPEGIIDKAYITMFMPFDRAHREYGEIKKGVLPSPSGGCLTTSGNRRMNFAVS